MNKLEKGLFENLTQNSGFYIKDYYSEYLNSSKWMAILENNDFVYAVIVCKYNDCDFEYEEAKVFLEKNYFKKIKNFVDKQYKLWYYIFVSDAGVAQLVERQPSKLNVASSTLVSRSIQRCVISSDGRAHDF